MCLDFWTSFEFFNFFIIKKELGKCAFDISNKRFEIGDKKVGG